MISRRELCCLIAVFALTLPAVTARLYSSDEVQYYSYLRSLWFDRDLSFDNEYRHFYDAGVARTDGFRQTFLEPLTPTGKRESFATIGCAFLWAPFYGLADLVTRAGWVEAATDGYSRPYVAAVSYGSATYAFVAVLLSIAAARRLTGTGAIAGLLVWFGTPLLFYMYAAPPFSHACSAFSVALFVTVWLRVRQEWTPHGVAALGVAGALMAMVREQDVFYALGPAVDYVLTARHGIRAPGRVRWKAAAVAALGVAAFGFAYSPQLLSYLSLNGRLGPSTLVTRKMSWTAPHAPGVLASPEHGLFVWTPLAAMAVIGLIALWRGRGGVKNADPRSALDSRRIGGCLLLMLALQVYVSGSVESWTVAGAFGQRRFVGASILFVIGLAALQRAVPAGMFRTGAAAIAVLAVWWNIGLMALFGAGLMDRQRLHPRQNAYDVFVTLPRTAPVLVYRYFTDRSSFYKNHSQ